MRRWLLLLLLIVVVLLLLLLLRLLVLLLWLRRRHRPWYARPNRCCGHLPLDSSRLAASSQNRAHDEGACGYTPWPGTAVGQSQEMTARILFGSLSDCQKPVRGAR
jgi:hypothetical protein